VGENGIATRGANSCCLKQRRMIHGDSGIFSWCPGIPVVSLWRDGKCIWLARA
jgi:hypothetical protein